jgi:hypothetical protein
MQEFLRCPVIVQRQPCPQRFLVVPPGQFQRGLQDDVPRWAEPACFTETPRVCCQQSAQGAKFDKQLSGDVECAVSAHAGPQQNRQQFSLGEDAGPSLEQLFARPLALRPLAYRHPLSLGWGRGSIVRPDGPMQPGNTSIQHLV